VIKFEPGNTAFSMMDPIARKDVRFTFDHVLPPEISQEEAYKLTAEPLLVDVFNGFNTTIFTYGQTGRYVSSCSYTTCILVLTMTHTFFIIITFPNSILLPSFDNSSSHTLPTPAVVRRTP
jgi:hypothetical protein